MGDGESTRRVRSASSTCVSPRARAWATSSTAWWAALLRRNRRAQAEVRRRSAPAPGGRRLGPPGPGWLGIAEGPLSPAPLGMKTRRTGSGRSAGVRSSSARCARNGATRSACLAASVTHPPGGTGLGAHEGRGMTQEVGPGRPVIAEGEPEGGLRLALRDQLPLEVRTRSGGSSLTAILPRAPRGSAVTGGPFAQRRLCCPPPPSGTPGRSDCLPAPAVSAWPYPPGLDSCRPRAGSPVVPVHRPRRHPAFPEGLVWLGRCASRPHRPSAQLTGSATLGIPSLPRLRLGSLRAATCAGCAFPFGSARQGTQCFRYTRGTSLQLPGRHCQFPGPELSRRVSRYPRHSTDCHLCKTLPRQHTRHAIRQEQAASEH